jgi:hypothetical protein
VTWPQHLQSFVQSHQARTQAISIVTRLLKHYAAWCALFVEGRISIFFKGAISENVIVYALLTSSGHEGTDQQSTSHIAPFNKSERNLLDKSHKMCC